MKKILSIAGALFVLATVAAQDTTPVQKVWNNGRIDYIPLGTEFRLEAENWNPNTGSIYYTYNAGESTEYTAPVVLDKEGQFTLNWATQDVWGTVSNTKTYTGIVDGTAPTIKFLIEGPVYTDDAGVVYVTDQTGIQLFGEDALSGTEFLYLDTTGTGKMENVLGQGFIYLTDREDGAIYAEGYAVDYVGNTSESLAAYVYLDTTAPSVYIDIDIPPVEANGVQYISPQTKISLSAQDTMSGVDAIYLSWNGAEFARYDGNTPISAPETGSHVLQVFATDKLGNSSELSEFTFSTDLKLNPAELYLSVGSPTGTNSTIEVVAEETKTPTEIPVEETEALQPVTVTNEK